MKKYIVLLIFLLLAGCGTPGITKREYKEATAKIHLGMTKAEFVGIFPSAEPRGAKLYPNGNVEVLEQIVSQYSFAGSGDPTLRRNEWTGVESRVTWFYFYNAKLVQYGAPNDWPSDPDKGIEVRTH